MAVGEGIAAALLAPLLEAVGFLEWDIYWSKARGSAFALNMYKCNFAAFLFLCMVVYDSNAPYLDYTIDVVKFNNDPMGYTSQYEKEMQHQMNPVNADSTIQKMLHEQLEQEQFLEQQQVFEHQQLLNQQNFLEQQQQIQRQQIQQQQIQQQQPQQNQQQQQQQQQQDLEQQQQNQQQQIEQQRLQAEDKFIQENQNSQNQHQRRLQVIGEMPVDTNEYVILERRKKTPYDASYQDAAGMTNAEEHKNESYQQRLRSPPPYPESYHRPFDGQAHQIPFIILSALLGIVIGDCAELEALRLIGARRVLVVDTIKPFAAAILGHILLDEALYPAAFLGMILTTLGVYVVLMASLAKVEQIKEKKFRGSMKRRGDLVLTMSNDDLSTGGHSAISDGTDGEDAEIVTIMNDESNRVRMVGMHRRPLSRHDLRADVEELLVDDDDLMMLLEDGRGGCVDATIFCNLDRSSTSSSPDLRKWPNGSSWASKHSLGNISFSSMGSLEGLNMDVNSAMENFDNDDDDFFFPEEEIDADSPPSKHVYDEQNTQVETFPNDMSVAIPDAVPLKPKSLKSALKKSRYNLKDSETNPAEDTKLSPSQKTSPDRADEKPTTPVDTPRKSRSRLNSQNSFVSQSSFVSVDTECGPPPGLYGSEVRRETKFQRTLRLRTGYFLAVVNVLLDAYGSYLTKKHGLGMSTWEINLCRLGFAGAVMSALSILLKLRDFRKRRKQRQSRSHEVLSPLQIRSSRIRPWYRLPRMAAVPWIIVSIGVCFVTFFAPALANFSLFEIPLALSVSLCSVTPLYTLPLGILMKGEKPSRRGYLGAGLSVLGVMILCIWGLDAASLD